MQIIRKKLRQQKVFTGGSFYIEYIENIAFGDYVYIGPDAYWSAKGGIEIGRNVIFGPKTKIWTYNHNYKSVETFPYGNDDILKQVIIKDDVWIGLAAIIMPGVTVNEGAIVAAGSVVVEDVPPCAVVAGNPAKVVSRRNELAYKNVSDKNRYMIVKYG